MFTTLFEKELKAIILSPKFVATFAVCSLLILLSVFIGIQEYRASVRQYETAVQLTDQQAQEATSWWGVQNKVYRKPDAMQIFASGVNNDVGRFSSIDRRSEVKLRQSTYLDDSLFALFRFIDFTFIVQVVLSLFAILFTYDAINGEREAGTLKLALSNAVPRGKYVLAKFLGAWTGLVAPLLIPIALALLIVMVLNVPVTGVEWAKLFALIGASILYFTVFIALGLFVSAMTKRSAISFLVLLVTWVAFVLILPRAATMAAGQLISVPSLAEIESQKDRYRTDSWAKLGEQRRAAWIEHMSEMEGMEPEEAQDYLAKNRQRWEEEQQADREKMEAAIAEFQRKIGEDLQNQKDEQARLAFQLSRFAPSSSYQLAAMNLAGTNISLKQRYEESMRAYRRAFTNFAQVKQREAEKEQQEQQSQGGDAVTIRFSGAGDKPLDLTEMPQYEAPSPSFEEAISPSIIDIGLLALYSIVGFAGAFVAFLRYDVR